MTEIASQDQAAGKRAGRIVVVTAGGENPWIMINALAARFADVTVIGNSRNRRACSCADAPASSAG